MMIRVNGLNALNFVSQPMFHGKAKEKNVEKLPEDTNLNGVEALASYNFSVINKPAKFDDIEPLEVLYNPGEEIDGERIYNSEGKLHAIVKDNGKTKNVFTPFDGSEELIERVDVVDKKSGQVVMSQENEIDDDKYGDYISVTKYSDGKIVQDSTYNNGTLESVSVTKRGKDSKEYYLDKNFADNKYYISMYDDKSGFNAELGPEQQLYHYSEYKNIGTREIAKEINLYGGSVISVEKNEKLVVPNYLGREKLKNPELLPAPKFEPEMDYKGHKGEAVYYSNGAIEKNVINNGEIVAFFDIDGNLERLKHGNREISLNPNGSQDIVEDLGDGKQKTTSYFSSGRGMVEVCTNDAYTEIFFDEHARPTSYYEGSIDENGEEYNSLSMHFNDKGMLTYAYQY